MSSNPNVENIRKWVDALRSGEYKQGKHNLATITEAGTEFCCLGVACEVAGLPSEPSRNNAYLLYDGRSSMYPPKSLNAWLGVRDADQIDEDTYLSHMNDREGAPFAVLADVIEAKYLSEVAS